MNFQQWLLCLYETGEVGGQADYAKEKGWEHLILAEHQKLSEHYAHLQRDEEHLDNAAPSPSIPEDMEYSEEWQRAWDGLQSDMCQISNSLNCLMSCLRHCYPVCSVCHGDSHWPDYSGGPGAENLGYCDKCYCGIDISSPL